MQLIGARRLFQTTYRNYCTKITLNINEVGADLQSEQTFSFYKWTFQFKYKCTTSDIQSTFLQRKSFQCMNLRVTEANGFRNKSAPIVPERQMSCRSETVMDGVVASDRARNVLTHSLWLMCGSTTLRPLIATTSFLCVIRLQRIREFVIQLNCWRASIEFKRFWFIFAFHCWNRTFPSQVQS